jgi:hypothetical protein
MANTYDRGDTIRLAGTFVASANQVVEPATVFLFVRNPLGSVGTYGYLSTASAVLGPAVVTRAASGCYYADFVPSCNPPNGVWTYRFDTGGGVGAAAGEQTFNVRPTPFL